MKKLIKVRPMWNRIITTMNVFEEDQYRGGLIDPSKAKGTLKEYQTVVAVGPSVRDIKVGDEVCIDPTRYAVMKHQDKSLKNGVIGDNTVVEYRFDTIMLDGVKHLMLYDQDVTYIVEESEEVEEPKGPTLVQLKKPEIIV